MNIFTSSFSKALWRTTIVTFLTLFYHPAYAGKCNSKLRNEENVQAHPMSTRSTSEVPIQTEEKPGSTLIIVYQPQYLYIPDDLFIHIFSFLETIQNQAKVRPVSKKFRELADKVIACQKIRWFDLTQNGQLLCKTYFSTDKAIQPSCVSALTSLNLRNCKIGLYMNNEKAGTRIGQQGTNVDTIDVSINYLKDEGAIALAKNLNSNVLKVDLSYNGLQNKGAIGFIEHIWGKSVHTVNLSYNYISTWGAIGVAQKLDSKMRTLDLSYNRISNEKVMEFAESLNPNVQTVNLTNTPEFQIALSYQDELRSKYPHIEWAF